MSTRDEIFNPVLSPVFDVNPDSRVPPHSRRTRRADSRPSPISNRAPSRPYSKSKVVHICGFQRLHVVAFLCVLSFFMLRSSRAVSTVLWALGMFAVGTLAHASLRSPNLKARLSSYREEFRAVWRGYSEA